MSKDQPGDGLCESGDCGTESMTYDESWPRGTSFAISGRHQRRWRNDMANKNLFETIAGKLAPKQALAQYAATGCLSGTYYATAGDQLAEVLGLCAQIDSEFIARTAVYCR